MLSIDRTTEKSFEESTQSTQTEDQALSPVPSVMNDLFNGTSSFDENRSQKTELSKTDRANTMGYSVTRSNRTADEGNPEPQAETNSDVEQLCLNFSSTSMSDETLLRLGITQYSDSIEHITQALDTAAVLVSEEMSAKVRQRNRRKLDDLGYLKSIRHLKLSGNEISAGAATAVSGSLDPLLSGSVENCCRHISLQESSGFGDSVATSSFVVSSAQLPVIEEEEKNELSEENLVKQSISNTSNDLFDRTCCSSISFQSADTPKNSYRLNRIRQRNSPQSPTSPSFRSPLHKMLKPGSPILAKLMEESRTREENKAYGDFKHRDSGVTAFQVIDVCG